MPADPKTPEVFARYSCATVEALATEHAGDVSEVGMVVRTTSAVAVGKLVDFEIQLANGVIALAGAGRIVWKRDRPDGSRPAGVAVKFVDLEDASRALVDRMVAVRTDPESEFDRPPGAEKPRTVLGLGSPFAAPSASDASQPAPGAASAELGRGRTQLGISPVALSADERARAGTRLGLAPPLAPTGLVLDEASSPAVTPPEAPRGPATSDIDKGWVDEAATGSRTATLSRAGATSSTEPIARDAPPAAALLAEVAPSGKLDGVEAPRPPPDVAEAAATDRRPRGRVWPWFVSLLLLLVVAAGGAYRFRAQLYEAGLPAIPTLPGAPSWLSGDEPPPPAPPPSPAAGRPKPR